MSYATIQTSAAETIAAKGQAVTLTRHSAAAYNTATGSATITDSTTTTSGVPLPMTHGRAQQAGTNILAGDQQLLLPGDITAPAVNDTVTIGGTAYIIVDVSPLNPGGTALIYDCVIRA